MTHRIPTQRRAKQTVDTLVEATARILEAPGGGPLTSNHIAARAGYAVGTFYDYFPNKQAVLHLMVQREVTRALRSIERTLATAPAQMSADGLVRCVLDAVLRPFGPRPVLRQRLAHLLIGDATVIATATRLQGRIIDLLIAALTARGFVLTGPIDPMGRHVLATAVSGVIQHAGQTEPAWIDAVAFEDSLVGLILRCLGVQDRRESGLP